MLSAAALGLLGSLSALVPAHAQGAAAAAWPERPIRVVLPFPPGGPSDMVLRLAAEKMQVVLKQPIVIDNKAGAGGNLGSAEVARAAPDGYTWLFAPDSIVTVNPHVYKKMPFKVDDLVPVTIGSQFNQTLVCNPALGVKTVGELIAKAKAAPLSYASGGAGVPGHLSMELLQSMAGFQMTHIPYKGPAPATQDVLANQVPCGLLAGPTVLPHVRAGKLVALGVSGSRRSPTLPDVPTLAEAGVAGYKADFTLGDVRPARRARCDQRALPAGLRRRARRARRDREAEGQRPDGGRQHAGRSGVDAGDRLEEVGRGRAPHPAGSGLIALPRRRGEVAQPPGAGGSSGSPRFCISRFAQPKIATAWSRSMISSSLMPAARNGAMSSAPSACGRSRHRDRERGDRPLALGRARRCRVVEHLLDRVAALGQLLEALRVHRRAVDAAVGHRDDHRAQLALGARQAAGRVHDRVVGGGAVPQHQRLVRERQVVGRGARLRMALVEHLELQRAGLGELAAARATSATRASRR